jgi:hypothetical protein
MTDSLFSLAGDLDRALPGKRYFAPPLAGFVPLPKFLDPYLLPGALPPPSAYAVEDAYVHDVANQWTRDVGMKISISPPFPTEALYPELPPPAIRLHAVAKGLLSFRPALPPSAPAQLVLTTNAFAAAPMNQVPWWQRWREALCIPRVIIYDNVDVAHLSAFLRSLPFEGAYGLKFPDVPFPFFDNASREAFVDAFLLGRTDARGNATHFMLAEASAVIGKAGPHPVTANANQVTLHARYSDDAPGAEQPMNPRELLYLMFGHETPMALNHPLLQSMDTLPSGTARTTRTTILRPPLRTWKRLMWESEREAALDQARPVASRQWSSAGRLASGTLFDTQFRRSPRAGAPAQGVSYAGLPTGVFKCNIFTSDISVRAGFRAMILDIGSLWHYPTSNSHANGAARTLGAHAADPPTRFPIMGHGADAGRLWGFSVTKFLTAGTSVDEINNWMKVDGRTFQVAGTRPKARGSTGHIVIVRQLSQTPTLVANNDPTIPAPATQTVGSLKITSEQASSGNGAVSNASFEFTLGGVPANAGSTSGFIRIHLIEPAAGRDPDLLQGLADLHVIRSDPNLLATPID